MKTMTFFNEKGGVGKSTFATLYASWLHSHEKKVAVIDYDLRLEEYRNAEVAYMKEHDIPYKESLENAWKIITADRHAIIKLNRQSLPGYHTWTKEILKRTLKDYDVVIFDLPGTMDMSGPLQLLTKPDLIGLVVVPFDRDSTTMQTTAYTIHTLLQPNGFNVISFLNQVQSYINKEVYWNIMDTFKDFKIRILPDMIAYSERMKKIGEYSSVRSTLFYPDWNQDCFKGTRDMGLENLFIDITKELKKIPAFKDTDEPDLSFIDTLEKGTTTQDLNRQLVGTMFPEYELEMPKEMEKHYKKNR